MKRIVYCNECAFLGAAEYDAKKHYYCPKCRSVLSISNILESDWIDKTYKEKEEIKSSLGLTEPNLLDNRILHLREKIWNEVSHLQRRLHVIGAVLIVDLVILMIIIMVHSYFAWD